MPSVLGYLLLPGEGRGLAAGVQEGVTAWKERSGGQAGGAGGGRRQEDMGPGSRNVKSLQS